MPRPDSRFDLGELVGQGGSGRVYRGTDTSTGKPVAIKVLHDTAEVGRLKREAESLAQLDHPAIASLIAVTEVAVTEVESQPCLVTDWVDGEPLSHLLRSSAPLAPARAIAIFRQLAQALDHAHNLGVVHRDVSPDNVMIGPNNKVTLIDFGLSRTGESATLTAAGVTAGTPRYLAPEVLEGANPSAASDSYGAAVVLYEMLTGAWPYGDVGSTISTTMHHHLNSQPTPASEVNTWLPASLDPVFDTALAKAPASRFARVSELADALEAANGSGEGASLGLNARKVAGVAIAAAVLAALITVWQSRPTDDVANGRLVPITNWTAGDAAALPCNLLAGTDFADGQLPVVYYDAVADRNDVASFGGFDQSEALRVGITDDFGLYGETMPVDPGESYLFSAHVSLPPGVEDASIRLFWMNQDFEQVGEEFDFKLDRGTQHVTLETGPAPTDAAYAVPSLVKEEADGFLIADELVFANSKSACADRLLDQ